MPIPTTTSALEALIREADALLTGYESAAIVRLDAALGAAIRDLEREARVLYRRQLTETDALSLPAREARARVLIEQLRVLKLRTATEGALDALITQAALVGVTSALAGVNLYEQGLVSRFGASPRFDAAIIATNTRAHLLHHGSVFAEAVEQAIIRGLLAGTSWSRLAGDIRRELGIARSRAEMLVRTESITASDEARRDTYQKVGVEYTQLLATMDVRVCGFCAARAGNVYVLGDLVLPLHPNCVVGATVVSAAGVSSYSQRWYEGPVVAITTRHGHRLTVTPNHPVLTPRGWVPAGRLDVGDHVLSQRGGHAVRALVEPQHEQVEGVIEELAHSFFEAVSVAAAPVEVADEHFHGDGRGSKIAVVGADRHLRPDLHAALTQQHRQVALVGAVMQALRFSRRSSLHQGLASHLAAASRGMRRFELHPSLLGRLASPLDALRFAARSDRHPALAERDVHCLSCGSELDSERFGALATFVPSRDLTPGEVRGGSREMPRVVEERTDALLASDVGARDGLDRLPFAVASDDVVAIERFRFAGHVYNLEAAAGMYVANGIMTHNCRCFSQPWRPEWQARGATNDAWYLAHHNGTVERAREAGEVIHYNMLSPSEVYRGREAPPVPFWTPTGGFTSAA